MKTSILFLVPVLLTGCFEKSDVAATVNGQNITLGEIDQSRGGQIAQQIYKMRRNAIEVLIDEKLLETEATAQGLSVEELLKKEVEAKVFNPSDAEVQAIYDANKDRFGAPLEEVQKQIVDSLKYNRMGTQHNIYVSGLREKAKIEYTLEKPPVHRVEVSKDDDPTRGVAEAKIEIIEFTDYQCPFCKKARPTLTQILEEYKDNISYTLRDFPLSFHKESFGAHMAAQCANDQGKYWEYMEKLFANQQSLQVGQLKGYAKDLGFDVATFDQCLDGRKHAGEVQKDLDEGQKYGVSGTPAFFINGILLSGAQPYSAFKEVIEDELKK